jgi:hypothetical protein
VSWQRTYACWRRLSRAAIEDAPANVLDLTWQSMVGDLRRILWEAGWSASDLMRPLAPTIDIRMTTDHADFFVRDTVALLAEARALELLHPYPLPDLRPFRWLK